MDPRGPILESIPNFSTSDPCHLAAIADAMAAVPGVRVLDHSADPDHNRAVVTLAGDPGRVVESLLAGCAVAVSLLDMRRHAGVHPRIGAVDVVPFVALGGLSDDEAAARAREFAARYSGATGVPVYFYGRIATSEARRSLPALRRGGFEGLAARMAGDPPDVGPAAPHPTAGATAVGVRPPLVAFNVLLEKGDLEAARRIAGRVRESSGGLRGVQAMGVWLAGPGRAQVSMNLTDLAAAPLHRVVRRLRELAREEGATLGRAELIGMLPYSALEPLIAEELLLEDLAPSRILEWAL